MKIIDEKGRLFGKINIIDFFVLALLFFFIPVSYFGYKIMVKKPLNATKLVDNTETMLLTVRVYNLAPEIIKIITPGDLQILKVLDERRHVYAAVPIAKIVAIIDDSEPEISRAAGNGKAPKGEVRPGNRDLTLKIEATCERQYADYYFDNAMVKIGRKFAFSTIIYAIEGLIIDMERLTYKLE
jgi:hypothetical protein